LSMESASGSGSREIVISGLLIGTGVVLPIFFHALGVGPAFSPMHIPALLAGFSLPLRFAFLAGIAMPLVSSLVTGMPPIFPVLPYMVFELATYAATASIMFRTLKQNIYVSLVVSMIAGRIAAGLIVWMMTAFLGVDIAGPFTFIAGSIMTSFPGMIVQLLLIPAIVYPLKKSNYI
jgi:hypothetical protein